MAALALLSLPLLVLGSGCQAPGTCTPPKSRYSWSAPVVPRIQWGDSGGYCGALSIQTLALTYGAYLSQDAIRKSTGPGGGHGDDKWGYEILHTNIEEALENLSIEYESWDWKSSPQPQADAYRAWMKKNLANRNPVIWFIYCKGDAHDSYGLGHYDHIEPVYAIYSNQTLNDTSVYPNDVIGHQSDWDKYTYYRQMSSLNDTMQMEGNCLNAVEGWPHDEAYPCIPQMVDYGYSIKGIRDTGGLSLPLYLVLDKTYEPNVRFGPPKDMYAKVTISNLKSGCKYNLLCYHGAKNVPQNGNYFANVHHNFSFVASGPEFIYKDPVPFLSDLVVYYFAIPINKDSNSMKTSYSQEL
ncbi:hypothetical protein AAMO2058_000874400 [Amorphochlora amoebiformis]